jgi:protoheme IX farnesyltransferase
MTGTFMQAACANTMNELLEIDRDLIMTRTQNRPLPTKKISKLHAFLQGVLMGAGGTYLLYKYNNPLTAYLGAANILLYAGVYTPAKLLHWSNTWIGTLNGSLPPLMGCSAVRNSIMDATGLYMFSLMYLWQISHFMAICYKCKYDYNKAGYKMLSISNPQSAANQSVYHAAALFPLCWGMSYYGYLPTWFGVISTPINYYLLLKPSIVFMKDVNYEKATALFFKSLGHLPALFLTSVFAFAWKQGLKEWMKEKLVDKVYGWMSQLFSSTAGEKN